MQNEKWNKNDLIALLVALALHAVLLVVILLLVIPTTQIHEKGGILVNIGDVEFASGTPAVGEFAPTPDAAEPQLQEPAEESLLTQETPDAPAIETPKENRPTPEELENQRRREAERQAEQRRKAEEEAARKRQEQIARQVSGAFGNAAQKSSGSGNTPDAPSQGREGSPDGNVPTGGVNTGVGGFGSYDLGGRSVMGSGLVRPSYSVQVEGTIRIRITVDPSGKVISTTIAPGTTIDNYEMQQSALQAARRTRFNAIEGTQNQTGTITYRYRLR